MQDRAPYLLRSVLTVCVTGCVDDAYCKIEDRVYQHPASKGNETGCVVVCPRIIAWYLPVADRSGHHDRDVVAAEQGLGPDGAAVRGGAALDEGASVH